MTTKEPITTEDIFLIRKLASAVLLQAVKDYCRGTAKEQQAVLKDLNGQWMNELTDGRAKVIAEQLLKNPTEISERLTTHNRSISASPRRRYQVNKRKRVAIFG